MRRVKLEQLWAGPHNLGLPKPLFVQARMLQPINVQIPPVRFICDAGGDER